MQGTGIAVADWKSLNLHEGDEYYRLIDSNGDVLYALRRFMDSTILRVDGARVLQAAAASDSGIQNLINARNDTPILTLIHVKKVATELKRLSALEAKSPATADVTMRSALLLEAKAWSRAPLIPPLPQSPWSLSGSGAAPSEPSVLAARAETLLAVNSTARLGYSEMAIGFNTIDLAVHFYNPSADTLYHASPARGMVVLQPTKKTQFYVCYSPDTADSVSTMFHWSYFVLLPSAAVVLGTFTAIPKQKPSSSGSGSGSGSRSEAKEAKDVRLAAAAAEKEKAEKEKAEKEKDAAAAAAVIAAAATAAELQERRKQAAAAAAAARLASLKAAQDSEGPFLEISGIGKCVYTGQKAVTAEWNSYSSITRCNAGAGKMPLVPPLEVYTDYSTIPTTPRKQRSRARRLSGGALIVKTLVGLYVLAAADDEDTSDDGNERKQPVGKLHVFAIDSGARTAKQLAISSILAQLPPSENVEQLRRMREYGDAFNAAHRLRLATPNKPKPQPQQNKPSPRGTCARFFAHSWQCLITCTLLCCYLPEKRKRKAPARPQVVSLAADS